MSKPRVSILLPVYNGEPYLRDSVQSVLQQTFSDFELLIWDDGSTDNSWEIVTSFLDNRIRKFKDSENRGLFQSLNSLIQHARGLLIRLWSADDLMKTYCLERENQFFEKYTNVGMFYCERDIIDQNGKIIHPARSCELPPVIPGKLADQISFNWGCMPGNIANVSVPRKVFDELGLFDVSMKQAADFAMWINIQDNYAIGYCRESLIQLRRHAGQLSVRPKAMLDFIREGEAIYKRLQDRLPAEIKSQARSYVRFVRHVPYLHAAIRAVGAGKLKYGMKIMSELEKLDSLLLVGFLWFITGNLHFYRPKPIFSHNNKNV